VIITRLLADMADYAASAEFSTGCRGNPVAELILNFFRLKKLTDIQHLYLKRKSNPPGL
jgi:hypothetical protein